MTIEKKIKPCVFVIFLWGASVYTYWKTEINTYANFLKPAASFHLSPSVTNNLPLGSSPHLTHSQMHLDKKN